MSTENTLFDVGVGAGAGLEGSRAIVEEALARIEPAATVLAFSGGDDSRTAYHVARALGVKIDFILHVNTRTGIRETTEFARSFAEAEGVRYVEADAGAAYENYVLNNGFFGRGKKAHLFAYHLLKAQHIRAAVSRLVRRGRKDRPVAILSGARIQESDNRSQNFSAGPVMADPNAKSNHWIQPLHYWKKVECREFLGDCKTRQNPVTERLCRSGECLCGTMQSPQVRQEAAFWYPGWGRWLDALERRVLQRFPWRWGEDVPRGYGSVARAEKYGQQRLPEFQPMCSSCLAPPQDEPLEIKVLR